LLLAYCKQVLHLKTCLQAEETTRDQIPLFLLSRP